MPKSNDYLFDLKHRLVGAAVLIVAAIIILPLVLTGQKPGYRHTLIGNGDALLPVQQTFISRIEVNSPNVQAQQSSADILKAKSELSKQSDTAELTIGMSNQRIEDNRQVNDTIVLGSGWVVRVGVFQVPENANKRHSLLVENGFGVNLEETKLDGKAAIRLFLGPFSSEDEAERMKAQAVMVTNDKAFVARYP